MNKTAKQVQGDIYAMLCVSPLADNISGNVYRAGMRPRDSKSEDAVVTFTAGVSTQIQTGIVTVNIYVPDIDTEQNGVLVENSARCEELEIAAQQWVDSLTADKSNYRFKLSQTITTDADEEIAQHFVVIKLEFQLPTF